MNIRKSTRNFLVNESVNVTTNHLTNEGLSIIKGTILPKLRSRSTFYIYDPNLKLAEENKIINESMKNYTRANRYCNKHYQYSISHKDIANRFEQFNLKINSILFSRSEIQELIPQRSVAISLKAGLRRTYRLKSQNNKIPLQIRFHIAYKPFIINVYVSERVQRPDNTYNDKAYSIKHREESLIYMPKESKHAFFDSDYIYITIETGCDTMFELKCYFGNFISIKQKSVVVKDRVGFNARTIKAEIANQLKKIVNNSQLLEECMRQARDVIRKNKLKNRQILRKDLADKQKKLCFSGITSNFEIRRLLASTKNAEIEENKRLKAFFSTNFLMLSRMYDKSMNETIGWFNNLKHNIRVIVAFIKLLYISRSLLNKFKVHRSTILRKELLKICHLRVYIFSISKFKLLGTSTKIRTGNRILAYFYSTNQIEVQV